MAKHRSDEGSNSDSSSGSLKEITADDFKQQDDRGPASRSRVWMGDHLMRYPPAVHRNYNQDLYSFAWAQAVQNKPLGFDVKPAEVDDDDDGIEMYDVEDNEGEEGGEKEEGELEEGEIEFGSEPAINDPVNVESSEERTEEEEKVEKDLDLEEKDEEIGEFDKKFGVILEELETITVEEAESSFEEVCSRLQKCFASLKLMHSEGHGPFLDILLQQAFMGIQTVYSAFNSGNLKNMDQNKELLLRLLIHIKNQYSVFLTPEQVKEIDVSVHALASEAVSVGKTSANVNGSSNIAERPGTSTGTLRLDPRGRISVSGRASLSKLEIPTSRSRVDFSPLLNLHADYDEDSLPSPTRDNAPPLPVLKPIGFGIGVLPAQPIASKNVKSENGTSHPYVTDPFQAVSSYQQKYGKNSTLVFNRLPSPTPSEDGNDGGDDIHGEVSSSSVPVNARTVGPSSSTVYTNSSGLPQMAPVNSSVGVKMAPFSSSGGLQMSSVNSSGGLQMSSVNSTGGFQIAPLNTSGGSQMAPVKASAKSRDPRLRFMNSEVGSAPQNGFAAGSVNSRKHKTIDEPVPDEHNLKRQRNGSTSSRDAQVTAGRGGWIEDNGMIVSQTNNRVQPNKNMAVGNRNLVGGEVGPDRRLVNDNNNFIGLNGGSAPNMSTSTAPVVSLPSLLKDIAVNPTMLVELIKMEQQRIAAAEAQQKDAGAAVNGLSSSVSPSPDVGQNPATKPQMVPQTTNMNGPNDMGKIRMKPRDPRRVLHSNMVQKCESLVSELVKNNGNLPSEVQSSKDRLTVQEQGEQAQTNTLPSQSASLPDISQQFTKNLQNLADIVSSSQASAPPVGTQNLSQPNPSKISSDTTEPKTVTGMCTQGETTSGASDSANPWGDVDHLLDGYDDQQKAAIQKERARRIEEQNKMFAERKLCLVLDLDHTLLNSAKFVEVDPIHEEILRQKEQEDRQRQERHLFRFPHMGMWTKLRPGVWNFLEKASKLYELHLYTMGNKLYATEMAKVLDPKGTLFHGRVISKGDEGDPYDGDERVPKSKDLDGVLGMESAVVIIDDSLRVWPHNKHNLIVVERYMYFPSSRRQFGLPGPSLLEINHDERPDAGTLASSLGVIERLHQIFFSHQSLNEVDVRNILAAEQRKILAGCKIVFSRVFPVGEANPHLHPLWQTAEQFGAECTNQIDEHVTHVVANSFGTDKVNWALSTGRFVVHPGWLEASALLYRRANEQDFAIKG